MGVYNWGIYTGYSLSYTLGNFITDANINNQGWRWYLNKPFSMSVKYHCHEIDCGRCSVRSFIIAGIPGIVIGFVILLTVREPQRTKVVAKAKIEDTEATGEAVATAGDKFKQMLKLMRPSLLLLCLASSIRNAGKYEIFVKLHDRTTFWNKPTDLLCSWLCVGLQYASLFRWIGPNSDSDWCLDVLDSHSRWFHWYVFEHYVRFRIL